MKRINIGKQGSMTVCLLAASLIIPAFAVAHSNSQEGVTKKELKQAISSASTSEDHLKIAHYYKEDAERLNIDGKLVYNIFDLIHEASINCQEKIAFEFNRKNNKKAKKK